MQVRKQQLEPDIEQQTGSKLGKEYVKAIYCHCLFNLYAEYIMRSARLDEVQAGIKIAGRNINNLTYADDTTLMEESEELKNLLMKVKEESEKAGLTLNIQNTKIMASGPIEVSEVKSLSRVWLFATPWTAAYQAPLSMGFSGQEYWSGLTFPSTGDLPNPGIEPRSPALQTDALPSEPPGKPITSWKIDEEQWKHWQDFIF